MAFDYDRSAHQDSGHVEDAIRSTRVALMFNTPHEEVHAALRSRGFDAAMAHFIIVGAKILINNGENA